MAYPPPQPHSLWNGGIAPISTSLTSTGLSNATKTDGVYSDTQIAIAFRTGSSAALTISDITLGLTVTGTPATTDIQATLCSTDSAGYKNAALETIDANSLTSNAYNSWGPFSTVLSANTPYWIIIRNKHATPASNFVTITQRDSGLAYPRGSSTGTNRCHFGYMTTTNNWTAASQRYCTAPWRVKFSDGTVIGHPYARTSDLLSANRIYGSQEHGIKLTLPGTCVWRVVGVAALFDNEIGVPPDPAVFRLYNDTTLLGTTDILDADKLNYASGYYAAYFDPPLDIAGGTVVRAVARQRDGGGTSSNAYVIARMEIHNDTDSKASLFGSCHHTLYNGTSWADDTNWVPMLWLLFDPVGMSSSGGGGGYTMPSGFQPLETGVFG